MIALTGCGTNNLSNEKTNNTSVDTNANDIPKEEKPTASSTESRE